MVMDRSARTGVVVAFLAVSLIWGSTYLGIRVALEGFPPFAIGAIRGLLPRRAEFAARREVTTRETESP